MRTIPRRSGARPNANQRRIIDTRSPEFGSAIIARQEAPAALAWQSANDPFAVPFTLREHVTVTRLGWINGSAITTSNFDLGIYSRAWARLISTGSTARAGASAWQWVDIADTALDPGEYYLAGASDVTSVSRLQGISFGTAQGTALFGAQDSATDAFPLPDPLTNMAAAATFVVLPMWGMECTGTFAPASQTYAKLPSIWIPENLYALPGVVAIGSLYNNASANMAVYCPVYFPIAATIFSVSFAATNGTGNYDLGLYDASWRLLASTGSTAMSAAGTKTLTFADMHVDAGSTLYVALANSSTSARYIGVSMTSLINVISVGCAEEASALPLPATATPVTPATANHLPLFVLGVR